MCSSGAFLLDLSYKPSCFLSIQVNLTFRNMIFYLLDVFGNTRYSGNQLAVFMDFGELSGEQMQKIAREINFSETTFITSKEMSGEGYPVRIFTPGSEVDFAGHPTLGTAYIIRKYLENDQVTTVSLNLKAGQIPVNIKGDVFWMKQKQPVFGETIGIPEIASVVGVHANDINEDFPVQEVSTGLPFIIVPLKTKEALQRAAITDKYWSFIEHRHAKAILVFCPQGNEPAQDLSSRVFVNYYGIPEDPATGSGTGCLAAWLVKYQLFGTGNLEIKIGQGYEMGRPSELLVKAGRRDDDYDIFVGGKVFELASGNWII
jgi:trans-2,3-dihydro-3-hydroxyanthranilate isomerase